jgi:transposase-like protein
MNYPSPPQSIVQLARMFATEQACADYMLRLRYPHGYACSKCGSTRAWPAREKPGMMICENDHKVSVTAGTALHRTKIPLTTWFHGAWLVATLKPGISAVQFQTQLGLTRLETAWALLHKLRAGLVAPERDQLTNACDDPTHTEHWVEIDEVLVGGAESGTEKRGRGYETKVLVMVAVEVHAWRGETDARDRAAGIEHRRKGKADVRLGLHTRAGRCRMRVVADGKSATIMPFILDNVARGSAIWTDDNPIYNAADRAGYRRIITVAKNDSDPLPTLGRVTTNLKRWLMGTHKGAVSAQHLQAYLNEYVFRFNRRDIPWVAFNRALGLAAQTAVPVEYEGLYKHTHIHPNPSQGPMQARWPEMDGWQ